MSDACVTEKKYIDLYSIFTILEYNKFFTRDNHIDEDANYHGTFKVNKSRSILLVSDGLINLALGVILLLFPLGVLEILGLPQSNTHFYPTILGGVLFGIGIALFIERYGIKYQIRGLGLEGAIAINFCGAIVLLVWLLIDPFDLPMRGYLVLWIIAISVLLIGLVELLTKSR